MMPPSVPAIGNAWASDPIKVYASSPAKQWRLAIISFVVGLLGLFPLKVISDWLHGGPMPDVRAFFALACLLFFPVGVFYVLNALRGLPRLAIAAYGVKLDASIRTKWASWDSVEPFAVQNLRAGAFGKKVLTASAKIVGPHASKGPLRAKAFAIPDHFQTSIETIVDELNAARAQAVGGSESVASSDMAPTQALVGLAEFTLPWLTLALLAVLVGIFALENVFAIPPSAPMQPSVGTLFAMGGISRIAVQSDGEWYRLFTAPLLHANFAHILGNGVALLFGGWFLERLVGRLWFFAFFVVGALGGALVSLAVMPPSLISVGASGALMGLFAALFISSFRTALASHERVRLQINSMRFLIPSLFPLFSSPSTEHIDYGAHVGGALSGAVLAAVLLKFWPPMERIPQLRKVAAGISIAGAILFVVSAGIAVANYPKYDIAVIPNAELPKTVADRRAHAADLAKRYPGDPRSHLFLGDALDAANDKAGAERELRLALATAQAHAVIFGPQVEASRAVLALFLAQQGKRNEAKDIAGPACSSLAKKPAAEKLLKLLTDQHLCD
jgi:rhomboid protease GluP